MRAIVTVFKEELKGRSSILDAIKSMASNFSEIPEAYTFSPKPGRLFEMLNLLKNNNISYGTHFNVTDDKPSSEL